MIDTLVFHLLVVFAGLAGFLLAFFIYHKKKTHQPLICPLSADCNKVLNSEYSHFLGMPLPLLGMGYYLLIAVTYAAFVIIGPSVQNVFYFIVLGITIVSLLFTSYLVTIQGFVLHEWCTWCLGSAIISLLIFLFSIFGLNIELAPVLLEYKSIIVILHGIAAAIGLGAASVTDVFFFRFLKDYKISHEENALLKSMSQILWFALGALILTGIGLFIPNREVLLETPKFLIKMILILGLVLNGVLLNLKIAPKLILISFGKRHVHQVGELHVLRRLAFASGAFSITTWYFVFILGSLRNVAMSFGTLLGIYLGLVVGAVIISQFFDYLYRRQAL